MWPEAEREFARWRAQARADLDDAVYNLEGGRYHLVCFLAQQAAEKAVKAFLFLQGNEVVWGHSVAELLDDASDIQTDLRPLRGKGAFLDRFCIPARYPNGLPGGIPPEAFDEKDAREVLESAREIIDFVSGFRGK